MRFKPFTRNCCGSKLVHLQCSGHCGLSVYCWAVQPGSNCLLPRCDTLYLPTSGNDQTLSPISSLRPLLQEASNAYSSLISLRHRSCSGAAAAFSTPAEFQLHTTQQKLDSARLLVEWLLQQHAEVGEAPLLYQTDNHLLAAASALLDRIMAAPAAQETWR